MFKAIGWLIKAALFAALVLVLGNLVHWKGRTVSDQVRVGIAHAERSDVADKLKDWTSNTADDLEDHVPKNVIEGAKHLRLHPLKKIAANSVSRSEEDQSDERLPSSERQKLRALIRELNSPTAQDR
jgi:hypothetical protein